MAAPHQPFRALVPAALKALREGNLPRTIVEDWRAHPAFLSFVVERLAPGARRVLDVGSGPDALLARKLGATGRLVVAVDPRAPRGTRRVASARAALPELPFPDGSFDVVTSRMMFGAPVSQEARRTLAAHGEDARNGDVHASLAWEVESAWWDELVRVSAPGALHVHHVLERMLYSRPPPALTILSAPDARVAGPARGPWSAHPAHALRFHASCLLVAQAPSRAQIAAGNPAEHP